MAPWWCYSEYYAAANIYCKISHDMLSEIVQLFHTDYKERLVYPCLHSSKNLTHCVSRKGYVPDPTLNARKASRGMQPSLVINHLVSLSYPIFNV